jgi:hypothetical protein
MENHSSGESRETGSASSKFQVLDLLSKSASAQTSKKDRELAES